MSEWRNLVCGVMIVVLPASLVAQSSGRGMLHNEGGVWLNGNPAPSTSAIFPQDLIQTQQERTAKIDVDGSTATVQPETIVQFDVDELALDHGGLQVNTARALRVRVACLTVIPIKEEWTRYDVVDVDGKVRVVAEQNDVKIHYQGAAARRSKAAFSDVIVRQGEQVTREDRCGAAAPIGNMTDGKLAILDTTWAKIAGGAAVAIIACFGLCHGDDPISPNKP